jgi:hypothetical protein
VRSPYGRVKTIRTRVTQNAPQPMEVRYAALRDTALVPVEQLRGRRRELLEELRSIDRGGRAKYFVCVPAHPIDTGTAVYEGAVYMWDATVEAAQARLDRTLTDRAPFGEPRRPLRDWAASMTCNRFSGRFPCGNHAAGLAVV